MLDNGALTPVDNKNVRTNFAPTNTPKGIHWFGAFNSQEAEKSADWVKTAIERNLNDGESNELCCVPDGSKALGSVGLKLKGRVTLMFRCDIHSDRYDRAGRMAQRRAKKGQRIYNAKTLAHYIQRGDIVINSKDLIPYEKHPDCPTADNMSGFCEIIVEVKGVESVVYTAGSAELASTIAKKFGVKAELYNA